MNRRNAIIGGTLLAAAGGLLLWKSYQNRPKGVIPVQPFDMKKYGGKWYEIARMGSSYEKNLNNTTAHYTLNKDGSIRVINRGHNFMTNKMKEAAGKAKFAGSPRQGKLKVSFREPFYSAYNIVALDPDYQYALVSGKNLNYLWLLSRSTTMPENIKQDYLQQAQQLGYDTSALIWVEHNV